MKALEILFNRRWVLKSEDKDLYYQIRDAVGEVRKRNMCIYAYYLCFWKIKMHRSNLCFRSLQNI